MQDGGSYKTLKQCMQTNKMNTYSSCYAVYSVIDINRLCNVHYHDIIYSNTLHASF